jgi:hypothetical protein
MIWWPQPLSWRLGRGLDTADAPPNTWCESAICFCSSQSAICERQLRYPHSQNPQRASKVLLFVFFSLACLLAHHTQKLRVWCTVFVPRILIKISQQRRSGGANEREKSRRTLLAADAFGFTLNGSNLFIWGIRDERAALDSWLFPAL